MNKEELILSIEEIPKFVLRDIATKSKADIMLNGDDMWVEQENFKAVTEETNLKPLAFVTKRYQLIQFEDVFKPLIQNINYLNGGLTYYGGVGLIDVFPEEERLKVNGGDKIGIVAFNSVDKTSSVIINFCIEHNNKKITIPKGIAGFKKVHTGKAIEITQDFLVVVDKVRNVWKIVLEEFSKIEVDENYANNVLNDVKINENYIRKKLLKKIMETSKMNLWDMFLEIIELVEERKFKSDYHKRKKLDLISEKIFHYAVISKLINA